MSNGKASTVNFRFWFESQIRNPRKPRVNAGSTESRFYYEKLLGRTKNDSRS